MKDTPPIKFGYVLRDLRTYHDYTQKDLSDYLNITTQAYSNYERDE
jgi:transcriptional regulator with XRE-family HTH domain